MKPRPPVAASSHETKRCAIYTRKSTSAGLDQEFNSLEAQRDACWSYIQGQPGWTVVDERYDDGGYTGANTDRPAFQRLLADVEAGKIDVIVVYKIDRLSRSMLDFVGLMERLNAADASFVSVTQHFSTANAMGRFTLNILMSFAEFEREMIAERTRDKIAGARRKGKWTGGMVPLGYRVVDKHLVIHELEAVVVREIFSMYLAERSVLTVTRLLNERHRATKRHRTTRGVVREARPWTKNDVQRTLKNPIYAGYMPYEGVLHEGEHAALIDRSTFAEATALLAAATRSKAPRVRNTTYLLRGLLRCGCCGGGFTPASSYGGRTEYRYYRCITRDKQGTSACPARPLAAEAIEELVIEQIRGHVSALVERFRKGASGEMITDIVAETSRRVAARRADLMRERQQLPQEVASLAAESSQLIQALESIDGPNRGSDQRLEAIDAQMRRCEQRLVDVGRELGNLDAVEVDAPWVARCLEDFSTVWDILSPDNRTRLLHAIVERVEVHEPSNTVKIALAELASAAHADALSRAAPTLLRAR